MANCLVITLIGPPKCGKTTFSKDLCYYLKNKRNFDVTMVAADDYLPTYTHVSSVLSMYERKTEGRKIVIILDKNMYEPSERNIFYSLCRIHRASYCQFFMEIEEGLCFERNQENFKAGVLTEPQFRNLYKISQKPENFQDWETHNLVIENPNRQVVLIFELYKVLLYMEENFGIINTM